MGCEFRFNCGFQNCGVSSSFQLRYDNFFSTVDSKLWDKHYFSSVDFQTMR